MGDCITYFSKPSLLFRTHYGPEVSTIEAHGWVNSVEGLKFILISGAFNDTNEAFNALSNHLRVVTAFGIYGLNQPL